ncbi:hypothetical protein L208DRAFT_1265040, partial [Tricholoma matsutake]
PIHPFANVPEVLYAPPVHRNFAAPAEKEKIVREKEPAYHTIAPIQNAKIIDDVYNRSMKAPLVTLSSEELLSISVEMHQKMRDAVTPKCITGDSPTLVVMMQQQASIINKAVSNMGGAATMAAPHNLASTGIIIPDPYETYLTTLSPGQEPEILIVTKESHALCSMIMMVDNQENIKAVIDPGSQIIAMSDAVCHNLGLAYDPTIQLNMQSANGAVDFSLGLAQNITCHVGKITLYLQVHVIHNLAYNILMG